VKLLATIASEAGKARLEFLLTAMPSNTVTPAELSNMPMM
jgi:hypothetical protein